MPDWLTTTFESDVELELGMLVPRILLAAVLGFVVAAIYRYTHGRNGEQGRAFMATLVLLTILIAMMTLVIGNNVARAFSLVGALAIVRFRTVVEDTRDTAFVIFAVSIGMAIGAGFLKIPLIAIPVAAVAAFWFRPEAVAPAATDGLHELVLRLAPATNMATTIDRALEPLVRTARLDAIGTARQGSAIERTYLVTLAEDPAKVVETLHRLDGVISVELKRR